MTTSPVERAADQFVTALAQWRVDRGMTKKQLAARMGFDPSYVSHVEGRRHKPTEDFARRAEAVLAAGGAIWEKFQQYDELRHARNVPLHRDPPVPVQWLPPGTGLIVEREVAELAYVGKAYRCRIRRALYNAGNEPVTRYLMKIAVDRYPHDTAGSNRHHREHPLTWDELDIEAVAGEGDAVEPMDFRPKLDRDASKEVWLLFANDHGQFPLYPGERTTIEYAYTAGEEKWGQWFQRAVRLPTRNLTVRLDFPLEFEPQVWGFEASSQPTYPSATHSNAATRPAARSSSGPPTRRCSTPGTASSGASGERARRRTRRRRRFPVRWSTASAPPCPNHGPRCGCAESASCSAGLIFSGSGRDTSSFRARTPPPAMR